MHITCLISIHKHFIISIAPVRSRAGSLVKNKTNLIHTFSRFCHEGVAERNLNMRLHLPLNY
jgi:hypothetical protein